MKKYYDIHGWFGGGGESFISTAGEFFKKYSNLYQFEEGSPEYLIDKEDFQTSLIEFTNLHVKAALEAAAKSAKVKFAPNSDRYWIDNESILNAYPLTNIV
jgi:hypothetical protein